MIKYTRLREDYLTDGSQANGEEGPVLYYPKGTVMRCCFDNGEVIDYQVITGMELTEFEAWEQENPSIGWKE